MVHVDGMYEYSGNSSSLVSSGKHATRNRENKKIIGKNDISTNE